ncbi:molybdopterin-binding protein [Nocardiopsis aegyptia]|uniref:molybdopterin-binding protein n=1 Tax=Nocardiopsis aegyptia TaxID=220378 RepID=UPI00367088DB
MLDADGSETSPLIHVRTRPHGSLSWPAARDAARATGAEGGSPTAEVPLPAALGAVLGADLVSAIDVPALDTAAMDGYAVAGEGPWSVLGRSLAGRGAPVARLRRGEAVEIATGAVVPDGTLAVLPYEEAEASGAVVYGACAPGRHIRRRGETVPAGALAARRGAPVTPALLGLAAGLGLDTLPVTRPVVRVLITGDEIVHSGRPRPGAVRDAIGPVLPGLVAWAGGRCEEPRALPDGRAALVSALAALPGDHVAAVGGSSSAGPADHLRAALAGLGARVVVDGVACRPGHPQLLAVLPSGAVVVGLPGNPGAALAAALTLLVPVLCGRTGRRDPAHGGRRARLSAMTDSHPTDTRLLPVRVHGDLAVETGSRGPADLRGAAAADALAVLPPAARGVAADGTVELVAVPT